jgi:DNA repair protein RecN (Recombination protein N)
MLQEIYISNFILIDELRLEFSTGMNILSGETGAGKSIIVDALGLVMGERINSDFVRDANHRVVVEAVFDVSRNAEVRLFLLQQGLADDQEEIDTIILSREIIPNGKTIGRINGRSVTIATLKSLSNFLVDMHLQNDRQSILRPGNYLGYVDSFGGHIEELLEAVAQMYGLLSSKQRQLQELLMNRQHRVQRLDFLTYQIKEIETSGLSSREDEDLRHIRERIKNAGKLLEGSRRILGLLYDSDTGSSAYDQVAAALDVIADNKGDSFIAELIEPLENIYYSLQELSSRISAFKAQLEFEPGQLEEVEDRLHLIGKLKTKYGEKIEDILAYLVRARAEQQLLEQSEERQDELQAEIAQILERYMQLARDLSQRRKAAALILEDKVHDELRDLNMPDIKFEVSVTGEIDPGYSGIDRVDFLFSPNPGEEMKPVIRVASGGEISRFILALKKALAEVYHIPTLVFDEIDVGLGGAALNSMARKLAELSWTHQLILVTHAPQVACFGDRNFTIEKYVQDGRTFTRVKCLEGEEKVRELARMLDGEHYSDVTLEHAREMMDLAQKHIHS